MPIQNIYKWVRVAVVTVFSIEILDIKSESLFYVCKHRKLFCKQSKCIKESTEILPCHCKQHVFHGCNCPASDFPTGKAFNLIYVPYRLLLSITGGSWFSDLLLRWPTKLGPCWSTLSRFLNYFGEVADFARARSFPVWFDTGSLLNPVAYPRCKEYTLIHQPWSVPLFSALLNRVVLHFGDI